MKRLQQLTLAAGIAALGLGLAGQAQAAFMIDDFNTATTYTCDSNGGGGGCGVTLPADGTNIVMTALPTVGPTEPAGWARTLSATSTGDPVSAVVCAGCAAGHLISGNGDGTATFDYAGGPSVDMSGYSQVSFRYAADHDGGTVEFTFEDSTAATASVVSAALANTAGSSNPANMLTHALALPGGVDYSDIVAVTILIDGVPELDATIDDAQLTVPVPATIALMGLGLVGLGWRRARS